MNVTRSAPPKSFFSTYFLFWGCSRVPKRAPGRGSGEGAGIRAPQMRSPPPLTRTRERTRRAGTGRDWGCLPVTLGPVPTAHAPDAGARSKRSPGADVGRRGRGLAAGRVADWLQPACPLTSRRRERARRQLSSAQLPPFPAPPPPGPAAGSLA